MNSQTTRRFRQTYKALPPEIQRRAARAYALFERDPRHPSLRFKKVHSTWGLVYSHSPSIRAGKAPVRLNQGQHCPGKSAPPIAPRPLVVPLTGHERDPRAFFVLEYGRVIGPNDVDLPNLIDVARPPAVHDDAGAIAQVFQPRKGPGQAA